jgi:hypothetical protein
MCDNYDHNMVYMTGIYCICLMCYLVFVGLDSVKNDESLYNQDFVFSNLRWAHETLCHCLMYPEENF